MKIHIPPKYLKHTPVTILLLTSFFLTGCGIVSFDSDTHVSSSLLDYLYPDSQHRDKSKQGESAKPIPHLNLPVRVGIAFVPQTHFSNRHFTPKQQFDLLQKAKNEFSQHEFIEHIEIIPSNYLQSNGGFTNLSQVANLFNVDLMALVSYDQVQKSYEKDSAFLYLTVVGAYVVKGEDIHTQSFVDTAVFDVSTQTLLFRAPGTHQLRRNSTLNAKNRTGDVLSESSFAIAMQNMLLNLDTEMNNFRARVKNERIAKLSYKPSYSGGGSNDVLFLLLLVFCLSFKIIRFRQDAV